MKLKLIVLTALAFFLLPVSILAANFTVGLEEPKSPTNQNNFHLTFVAGTHDPNLVITVRCFKKGPSDGGFVQFDVDKILTPGGNTDYCDVNSSILSSNGSYKFLVKAEASSTIIDSNEVTVDYNTSGPDTPNSYSKERPNSCDYKIKFRTANDGKTVKVQLFRSDTFNISVGASSVLTQQNIGPNLAGEFVNSVPVCGKDYYYVLRAVDNSDNASGTIGDSFTTTTTSSSTVTGATGSTGAIALSGAKTQIIDGTAGTDAAKDASTSGTAGEGSTTPTPEILGTSTDQKKDYSKWYLIAALILGYLVSRTLRAKKSK